MHIGARDCYLSVIKLLGEALHRAAEKDVKPLEDLVLFKCQSRCQVGMFKCFHGTERYQDYQNKLFCPSKQ